MSVAIIIEKYADVSTITILGIPPIPSTNTILGFSADRVPLCSYYTRNSADCGTVTILGIPPIIIIVK